MLAAEVSHDILAAIIGSTALVIVATIPFLWKRVNQTTKRQDLADLQHALGEIEARLRDLADLIRNHR